MPGFSVLHYLLEFTQIHDNSWLSYLTVSFSATPSSFCLQSFPASGSFSMSQLFTSGGQSIGASASVLPMNIQGWFPLGMTGLISLQSKGKPALFQSTLWDCLFQHPWKNLHSCDSLVEAVCLGKGWATVWIRRKNKTVKLLCSDDITHPRITDPLSTISK